MVSSAFSVANIHAVALLSCCSWFVVTIVAHTVTSKLWPGYSKLKYKHKLAWCNRIASGTHAMVLVMGQLPHLTDPILNADPLFGVTDSHFFWGSIMYGYLIYDTIFTLIFYSAVGSTAFLLHHCLGLICCCFGLYFNKMALFGTAIQVFFEGTTPLLHLMGCLKLMGKEGTPSYTAIGFTFVAQFFVCRVVIATYYWGIMLSAVAALETKPAWASAGVVIYGVLTALNLFWFYKLMQMAREAGSQKQPVKAFAAVKPLPHTAAATDITAVSAQAALSDVSRLLLDNSNQHSSALQHCKNRSATWIQYSQDQTAGALQGFRPAIAGLEPRLSDSSDAPVSAKFASAQTVLSGVSAYGPAILACWERRSSGLTETQRHEAVEAVDARGLRPQHAKSRLQMQRPPASPFAAMAAE